MSACPLRRWHQHRAVAPMGVAPDSSLSLLPNPRYNSAKKDNDFIYHEAMPALDTLQPVKGLWLREAECEGMVGEVLSPKA